MSGLITVCKDKTWLAANWVFDHVIRVSRKHLPTEGSERIFELLDNVVPGLNSISLENLTPEELEIFHEALKAGYYEVLASGEESFGEPTFYPAFLERYEELLGLFRSDKF